MSVVCAAPSSALCPQESTAFLSKCLQVNHVSKTFRAAAEDCNRQQGKLLEIHSQSENDFITELLDFQGEELSSFWIGGLVNTVVGKNFFMWYESQKPILYSKFLSEPEADNQDTALRSNGISIASTTGYFFWHSDSLEKENLYICELPQIEIGCIHDVGAEYVGQASRGESGAECLRWDTPGLPDIYQGQTNWRHNYCR